MPFEPDINLPPEPPSHNESLRERNMTLLLSLFLILLAFFIQMTAVSDKNPSRVDSAVSSITQKFGKSANEFEDAGISAASGVLIKDMPYLDAVVSATAGMDSFGEVKSTRKDGTLTLRIAREQLFVTNTGVIHPDGVALISRLADAMTVGNNNAALRCVEIRLIAAKSELSSPAASTEVQSAPIRQAAALSQALNEAGVPSRAISAGVSHGAAPMVEMKFYALTPDMMQEGAK